MSQKHRFLHITPLDIARDGRKHTRHKHIATVTNLTYANPTTPQSLKNRLESQLLQNESLVYPTGNAQVNVYGTVLVIFKLVAHYYQWYKNCPKLHIKNKGNRESDKDSAYSSYIETQKGMSCTLVISYKVYPESRRAEQAKGRHVQRQNVDNSIKEIDINTLGISRINTPYFKRRNSKC